MSNTSEEINAIKIQELEKRMLLMSDSATKAIEIASRDLKARLDGMNEFRLALKDQQGTFIIKEVYDRSHEALENRIKNIELFTANIQGRIWMLMAVSGAVTTIIAIIISLVPYFLKK